MKDNKKSHPIFLGSPRGGMTCKVIVENILNANNIIQVDPKSDICHIENDIKKERSKYER